MEADKVAWTGAKVPIRHINESSDHMHTCILGRQRRFEQSSINANERGEKRLDNMDKQCVKTQWEKDVFMHARMRIGIIQKKQAQDLREKNKNRV